MALVDLVMPKLGESIMEATILKWHKKPGDKVKQDETVLEIATDKVDSEVPSTAEGVVEEILFSENDVVPIGSVIAKIRTQVEEKRNEEIPVKPPVQEYAHQESMREEDAQVSHPPFEKSPAGFTPRSFQNGSQPHSTNGSGSRFYSPLVLNIAANESISMNELENIHGTGNEGRVTKKDILRYVAEKKSGTTATRTKTIERPSYTQPEVSTESFERAGKTEVEERIPVESNYGGNVEIMEMDRMRKLIAEHMVRSKQTSPHVTSFTEADVTNLVVWREKVKLEFEKREGAKLTLTPLFIEAVVRCIKKYPLINCSVDKDKIIIKKDINIGMATALPSGNLIVPVIRNADQFNLVGLARQVNALADNARSNKLRPEDIQGGTFTITNVGIFG
ncbi:MAG TPA: dihydrolipoamide acetyltransferase family protein, partial [Puia sp.]|nr:dihydrolipoamide acetyltransferase family protein [Puia sp.]